MKTARALGAVNKKIREIVDRRGPALRGLFEDASLDAGKRLRAGLFFNFSQSYGNDAVKIASAIELLHAATLIHDDVLDASPMRRGRQALHVKRGIPLSILYGDYLFSESFSMLAEAGNPRIWEEMTRSLSETLKGEIEEQYRRGDVSLTEEEYLSIIEKKSGTLFGAACKTGLILKDRESPLAERAYKFGLKVGSAYQILDDCSDYFGHNGGKGRFNDFREGVITLPLIYLLKRCSRSERSFIIKKLKGSKACPADFKKIKELMKRYGVISDCCALAQEMLDEAEEDKLCRRRIL
ncbi:MAG: polyprenyl synthetase family protein [Candidatus Omnitrophica bacterium]|nr:polyprenyl synthetase family protein [Candidatus Omnitrophota bacterium]